jgi:putative transposase
MKPNSHVRRGADEWRRLVHEQADSGLSQAAFCKTHRLSLSTFQYWKKRIGLSHQESPAASAAWIELPSIGGLSNGWDIELDLGDGVRLRLSRR